MCILDSMLAGKFDQSDQSAIEDLDKKIQDFKQLVQEIVDVHVKAR